MKSASQVTKATPHGPAATARLFEAWQSLSKGSGSREDFEIVLADLAAASGYFDITPSGVSGDTLRHNEGRREVFARISFLLGLKGDALAALMEAASHERQIINSQED